MAVNLEELALKSIENYAALNVKMSSLEVSISEMNRKAEINQDKFSLACDKLTRLEEKISSWVEDRRLIHERIDDTKTEVDKLISLVKDLATSVKEHKDDHCDDCFNNKKVLDLEISIRNLATKEQLTGLSCSVKDQIEALDRKLEIASNLDANLMKAREIVSTPYGIIVLKSITSKWGATWVGIVTLSACVTFYMHHQFIKDLWDLFTLK